MKDGQLVYSIERYNIDDHTAQIIEQHLSGHFSALVIAKYISSNLSVGGLLITFSLQSYMPQSNFFKVSLQLNFTPCIPTCTIS